MSFAGLRSLVRMGGQPPAKRFLHSETTRSTTSEALMSVISTNGRVRVTSVAGTASQTGFPILPNEPPRPNLPAFFRTEAGESQELAQKLLRQELAHKAAVLNYIGFGNAKHAPNNGEQEEISDGPPLTEHEKKERVRMCINTLRKLRSWKHKMSRGKHNNKWGRGANPICR